MKRGRRLHQCLGSIGACALLAPLSSWALPPPTPLPVTGATTALSQVVQPDLAPRNIQTPAEPVAGPSATIIVRSLSKPLVIKDIAVSDLVGQTGNQVTQSLDASLVKVGTDCVRELGVQRSCGIKVSLSENLSPGRYKASVAIASTQTLETVIVKFDRRGPMWWAQGLILGGMLAGAVVAYWLGGARDHAVRALRVKKALRDIKKIKPTGNPDIRAVVNALVELAGSWQRDIQLVSDEQATKLELRASELAYLEPLVEQANGNAPLLRAVSNVAAAMLPLPSRVLADVDPELFREVLDATKARAAIEGALPSIATRPSLPFLVSTGFESAFLAFRLVEHFIALLLALIFAAIAINAFYVEDPAWGSTGDKISIFLIGFGAYAGSISSVSTFLGRGKALAW